MPTPPERRAHVVVVAGGDRPDLRVALVLPPNAFVVAADSGADHALELGLAVDELIGDLDSVTPATLAALETAGVVVQRHPEAKDCTDLELALARAAELRPETITVVGGHGGRVDHQVAGLLLLAAPGLAPARVTAWHGSALVTVLRPGAATFLNGPAGSLLSLLPVGGAADGVTTVGLDYPLCCETLSAIAARGMSNRLQTGPASVSITAGTLLAIQTDALEPATRPCVPVEVTTHQEDVR